MKREFLPAKDYPVYNNEVDRLMLASAIFNGGANTIPNVHTTLFDKGNLINALLEIEGEESTGLYKRNGEVHSAYIPFIKFKILELETSYQRLKKDSVNTGREVPTEMPAQMLENYYLLKARLTVYMAECEEIRKKIKEFKVEEEKESDAMVLKYGLIGLSKTHGVFSEDPNLIGVLKIIDGQKVVLTEDGHLILNDSRSIYSGMLVQDYRRLCKEWQTERKKADREKFKQLQEKAKAEGNPMQPPTARAPRRINRASLPVWPEWAKNYLIKEPDETVAK